MYETVQLYGTHKLIDFLVKPVHINLNLCLVFSGQNDVSVDNEILLWRVKKIHPGVKKYSL